MHALCAVPPQPGKAAEFSLKTNHQSTGWAFLRSGTGASCVSGGVSPFFEVESTASAAGISVVKLGTAELFWPQTVHAERIKIPMIVKNGRIALRQKSTTPKVIKSTF